jgi:hypothetical protein
MGQTPRAFVAFSFEAKALDRVKPTFSTNAVGFHPIFGKTLVRNQSLDLVVQVDWVPTHTTLHFS